MKIVLMGPAYPLRGGIAQYLAVLYEKLHDAGHDVHFVSFIKQFPNWLFPGKTQLEHSEHVIDVKPTATFAPLGVLSWRRTAKEIAKHDPDLVVFKWWMPFFGPGYWAVARWLRKHTKARVLFIIDNTIPHEARPGDKFLTKLAFSQVNYFVAQSRAVEKDTFEWFPDLERKRIKMCPHPIYDCYPAFEGGREAARTELGLTADAKTLLFFGFVREYKGLHLLLDALPAIRKQHPSLRLLIVGEFYDSRDSYDKKIQELKLQDCVSIRDDYVPNEEVGKYFAAADCVVLPYRSATQSGIIQVAYALDLPVITTDVGGLAEVVEDNVTGYIVSPGKPEALADAVNRFYEAGGRPAFEDNVKRASKQFSWEGLVTTLTDSIQEEKS
jgi:glycosyltransferase involved in cell wall biosynthesis